MPHGPEGFEVPLEGGRGWSACRLLHSKEGLPGGGGFDEAGVVAGVGGSGRIKSLRFASVDGRRSRQGSGEYFLP